MLPLLCGLVLEPGLDPARKGRSHCLESPSPLPLQPTDQTGSWLGPRTLACFLIGASENLHLLIITAAATTCLPQVPQVPPVLPSRTSALKGNFASWRVGPQCPGCSFKHNSCPRFRELVRKYCFDSCCFYCCYNVIISKCPGRRKKGCKVTKREKSLTDEELQKASWRRWCFDRMLKNWVNFARLVWWTQHRRLEESMYMWTCWEYKV